MGWHFPVDLYTIAYFLNLVLKVQTLETFKLFRMFHSMPAPLSQI